MAPQAGLASTGGTPSNSINASTESGTILANDLDAWALAVQSNNTGASRPSAINGLVAGMLWINNTVPSGTVWTIYYFDGTNDCPIGYLDTTNHQFTPMPGGGVQSTALASTMSLVPAAGGQSTKYVTTSGSGTGITISSFGSGPTGTEKRIVWNTVPSGGVAYNGTSMILPTGASLNPSAGDVWEVLNVSGEPSGSNWLVTNVMLATGSPLVAQNNITGAFQTSGVTTTGSLTSPQAALALGTSAILRVSSAANLVIAGMVPGATPSGRRITIVNINAFSGGIITFPPLSSLASAANQFGGQSDNPVFPGCSITFEYDLTTSLWMPIGSSPSAPPIQGNFKNLSVFTPTTVLDGVAVLNGPAKNIVGTSSSICPNGSPNVNWTAHGFITNQPLVFELGSGNTGSLPTQIIPGTTYYVSATGNSTNSFQLSTFPNGPSTANFSGTNTASQVVVTAGVLSQMSATADVLVVSNGLGVSRTLLNVSVTADLAVSGINGLDTGSISAAKWYYFFVVYNPSTGTVGALWSLSATSPTLPAGYTMFARVGVNQTDLIGHLYPIQQYNRIATYLFYPGSNVNVNSVGGGTSPTSYSGCGPYMFTGGVNGSLGTGASAMTNLTFVACQVRGNGFAAPPTANRVGVIANIDFLSRGVVGMSIVTSLNYLGNGNGPQGGNGVFSSYNIGVVAGIVNWYQLEGDNFYVSASGGGGQAAVAHWEDSI